MTARISQILFVCGPIRTNKRPLCGIIIGSSDTLGARSMMANRCDEPRLLIADDDTAFRRTVVEILSPYFQVIDVPSGEEAIQIVETTSVHLALFDLNMDLLTGLDAIRWVRERQLEIPCILMSSDITVEIEDQARQLDTFSVIRKPPRRSHLLDIIHCALEI